MSPDPALALVWDDRFLDYDLGPGHPFSEVPRKLGADLVAGWASAAGVPVALHREVPAATTEQLARFHTRAYLRFVERCGASGNGAPMDAGDTPSFPGCDRAAARIAGGTLRALATVRDGGPRRAFQPAGGLHHAHRDRASGFCIFNDIAVGLANGFADGTIQRAAYVDIDVHHGDGVLYGFYDDGRLLDIDFHQDGRTIFPVTGEPEETGRGDGAGRKVNLPLPPGAGDAEFLALWDRLVPALLEEHRPDVIVLQCGVDGHVGDLLGRLRYTAAAYDHAVRSIVEVADRVASGRLVVTGGGGYEPAAVAVTLGRVGRILAGGPTPEQEEPLPAAWRSEFERLTGAPSPAVWEPVRPPTGPATGVDRLVERLEGALGRKFPRIPEITR
jgi:acetoin utilization protein AcuC